MLVIFGLITFATARGSVFAPRSVDGLWAGALAEVVRSAATMLVSALVLNLPWYATPRRFATMVMGRAAVANILGFDTPSFIIGLIIVLVLTSILGWVSHCFSGIIL
jgi:hypothetical protein